MIIIDGQRFACQSCIKGHRARGCAHGGRPLFEIRKKGRPPTQCQHCRDLRKSRSVHVKCTCEGKAVTDPIRLPDLPRGVDDVAGTFETDGTHCGCHHGKGCTCAGGVGMAMAIARSGSSGSSSNSPGVAVSSPKKSVSSSSPASDATPLKRTLPDSSDEPSKKPRRKKAPGNKEAQSSSAPRSAIASNTVSMDVNLNRPPSSTASLSPPTHSPQSGVDTATSPAQDEADYHTFLDALSNGLGRLPSSEGGGSSTGSRSLSVNSPDSSTDALVGVGSDGKALKPFDPNGASAGSHDHGPRDLVHDGKGGHPQHCHLHLMQPYHPYAVWEPTATTPIPIYPPLGFGLPPGAQIVHVGYPLPPDPYHYQRHPCHHAPCHPPAFHHTTTPCPRHLHSHEFMTSPSSAPESVPTSLQVPMRDLAPPSSSSASTNSSLYDAGVNLMTGISNHQNYEPQTDWSQFDLSTVMGAKEAGPSTDNNGVQGRLNAAMSAPEIPEGLPADFDFQSFLANQSSSDLDFLGQVMSNFGRDSSNGQGDATRGEGNIGTGSALATPHPHATSLWEDARNPQ